jgi:hypothetical protein
MLNHSDPNKQISRIFASHFEIGECFGYFKFYSLSKLKESGYLSSNGTLSFKFFVRSPSYYLLCRDQSRYIEYLETQIQSHNLKQNLVEDVLSTSKHDNANGLTRESDDEDNNSGCVRVNDSYCGILDKLENSSDDDDCRHAILPNEEEKVLTERAVGLSNLVMQSNNSCAAKLQDELLEELQAKRSANMIQKSRDSIRSHVKDNLCNFESLKVNNDISHDPTATVGLSNSNILSKIIHDGVEAGQKTKFQPQRGPNHPSNAPLTFDVASLPNQVVMGTDAMSSQLEQNMLSSPIETLSPSSTETPSMSSIQCMMSAADILAGHPASINLSKAIQASSVNRFSQ